MGYERGMVRLFTEEEVRQIRFLAIPKDLARHTGRGWPSLVRAHVADAGRPRPTRVVRPSTSSISRTQPVSPANTSPPASLNLRDRLPPGNGSPSGNNREIGTAQAKESEGSLVKAQTGRDCHVIAPLRRRDGKAERRDDSTS